VGQTSEAAHTTLNSLPLAAASAALTRCCGAQRWVEQMLARRPFASSAQLLAAAREVWARLDRGDYLEAFSHHPRIGADVDQLAEQFASTSSLSAREQSGTSTANRATLLELHTDNQRYLERFGYIFIVCATGKSAAEMLELLRARLTNDPGQELAIAAEEQAKITAIRLLQLATLSS
jgi:2-oxo-4-hydroxy-4-carboxy-5-ureidoimidazoline decarboxylase